MNCSPGHTLHGSTVLACRYTRPSRSAANSPFHSITQRVRRCCTFTCLCPVTNNPALCHVGARRIHASSHLCSQAVNKVMTLSRAVDHVALANKIGKMPTGFDNDIALAFQKAMKRHPTGTYGILGRHSGAVSRAFRSSIPTPHVWCALLVARGCRLARAI